MASPARRWPPERFAEVARAELARGRRVIVTGGPSEVDLAHDVAARAGLRPEPFYLGLAYAGLGLGLSALLVRETRGHAQLEAQLTDAARPTVANPGPNRTLAAADVERPSTREVFVRTSLRERALSACSQAGLVNNLNDGLAWGLLPLLFVRGGTLFLNDGVTPVPVDPSTPAASASTWTSCSSLNRIPVSKGLRSRRHWCAVVPWISWSLTP
jgi:hypothetical protein